MYSILIVDDERIERDGMEKLIRRLELPLQAEQAPNGEAALEKLKQKRFDMLLTDIKMPFMDGITLIHEARKLYPDLVTLIFSAYSDFEKARAAIREQVQRYILKPVNISEFQATMQACIRDIEDMRASADEKHRLQEELTRYRSREAQLRSCLREEENPPAALAQILQADRADQPEPVNNPAISRAVKIIRAEYMKDIGLEEVADRVNLSPGYLSALFSQQLGQSFVKYLNQYRLGVAERMLCETNMKVSDIAAGVGFPGESYFISLFKQRFGMTPRSYRKQLENVCETEKSCSPSETGN